MNKHLKLLSISFTIVCSLFLAAKVQAIAVSTDYVPLTTVPGVFKAGERTNPVVIVKNLYGFAIGIGGVIAVVMIIYAGFEYMYKESITGKSDAKGRITNAFLGLAVILGSYILLRTINPALVNFDVNLPSGSGRVAHLAISQSLRDQAAAETQVALKKSSELRAEVAALEKEAAELQEELGATRDNSDENFARLTEVKKQIQLKKLEEIGLRTGADIATVTTSIDENTFLRENKGVGNGGYAIGEDNMQVKHSRLLTFFDTQIEELKKFDQTDPTVIKTLIQVEARKGAAKEEFDQQVKAEKILIPPTGVAPATLQSEAKSLKADIRSDIDTQTQKLLDAGLRKEAEDYAKRGENRIASLCGIDPCGK